LNPYALPAGLRPFPTRRSSDLTALLRLAKLTGRRDLYDKGVETIQAFRGVLEAAPSAAGQMLLALDFHLGPVREIAVIGDLQSPAFREVLRVIHGAFRPNDVVAGRAAVDEHADRVVPLLAGKTATGPVTTYVCRDFTFQA